MKIIETVPNGTMPKWMLNRGHDGNVYIVFKNEDDADKYSFLFGELSLTRASFGGFANAYYTDNLVICDHTGG